MSYLGDILEDATIRGGFNTRQADGTPITLGGTPALSVYKDAGTTESTAGVTLTVDFDSRTGHHIFTIDTSADAFYTAGSDYRVVITTGTVDSISVVGVQVGSFSIEKRNTKADVRQLNGNSNAAAVLKLFADILDQSTGQLDSGSFAAGAIAAATFAADVDAEFLSYIVDDATRIDASALNTASGTSIPAILDDTANTLDDKLDTLVTRLPEAISLTPGGAVTVATNNDKTGYSLTATTGLGNQTANITGNLSGSVGSVTGGINTGSGTITTLDALDTAQDSQHATTQSAIGGLNNLSAAQVNSEVDTALADIHLDHLLAVDYDPASKPGVATALLNELIESDGGVSRYTANALEQGPGGGSAPTVVQIADAVWDEILSGHVISGSAGAVLSGVGSVAGSGARTVAVTVTIDSVAISGAKVRVTKGGESYLQATNGSGQVTFNLDDGTWTVAITSPGATFAGTTLVVDGNETVAYDMDAVSLPVSDPDKVTAYYLCLDTNGDPQTGVVVTLRAKEASEDLGVEDGIAAAEGTRTDTTTSDGIASFANVLPGYIYAVTCGTDKVHLVEVPSAATSPFSLRSIVR